MCSSSSVRSHGARAKATFRPVRQSYDVLADAPFRSTFGRVFSHVEFFFWSDGSTMRFVLLQVPVLCVELLHCCPPTRVASGDHKYPEVCAGSDMFHLHAVDTYLSDTCQHPIGTRLLVFVLVCSVSPLSPSGAGEPIGETPEPGGARESPTPTDLFVSACRSPAGFFFFVCCGCLSVASFSEHVSKPVPSRSHYGFNLSIISP